MQRSESRNLILIGFMGTGKSAVGRQLARRLHRPYLDTDQWIIREAGMPIPELFERFGETAFRDVESKAVDYLCSRSGLVVSTGGGILGRDENLEALSSSGTLICLSARPEVILARTAPWENRPMLRTAANPREAVERLLRERAEKYGRADLTVDTSDLSVREVVDEICARLSFP